MRRSTASAVRSSLLRTSSISSEGLNRPREIGGRRKLATRGQPVENRRQLKLGRGKSGKGIGHWHSSFSSEQR